MARFHGSTSTVYLGSRDVSADLSSINISAMADVGDVTNFASNSAKEFDVGLRGWEAEIAAFYQGDSGGIGRQLETLLGAAGGIISVYNGPTPALGATGILLSDGVLTKRGQPIAVADLIKLTGSFKATGSGTRPGLFGRLLHPLGQETAGASATATYDSGASSANGGRATMHITAATGTGGIVIVRDSPDDLDWSHTLLTFATAAAAGAQTIEVSGNVMQYLRVYWTVNALSTLTFVAGLSRYRFA